MCFGKFESEHFCPVHPHINICTSSLCCTHFSLFVPFQPFLPISVLLCTPPSVLSAHLHCTPHFVFAHPFFLNICTPVFTSYTSTIDNLAPLFMFILFWACVLCSLHAPPLPHAPLFYLIHLHVYHFFSSRTSVYDNPTPTPVFFVCWAFAASLLPRAPPQLLIPHPYTHFLLLF